MRAYRGKLMLSTICAVALMFAAAAPARAAFGDPLYVFVPSPPPPEKGKPSEVIPPPTGYLNGPCGIAIDAGTTGNVYVSDYYNHAVDVFAQGKIEVGKAALGYTTQIANEDPLDGPCGLALESPSNKLYVNNFHRNLVRFDAQPLFGSGSVFPLPLEQTAQHLPTGVAVDPVSGNVLVDNRTYLSVYTPGGALVEEAGQPLRIGVGSLGDGYGIAVSRFPATFGRVYVPDAVSNTVKVFDPATDKVNPVETIKDPFGKPFVSLRNSAVAVDDVTGDFYFADNTQPQYTEHPQATIYVYGSTGSYKGHLKYNVVDALPVGIAVDNSKHEEELPNNTKVPTQGRVYVTSGNTNQAGIYVYAPGSGVFGATLPPTFGLAVSSAGSGSGSVSSAVAGLNCVGFCERQLLSGGRVELTATPDPGSEFSGWSGGDCVGAGETCTVQMFDSTSLVAHFAAEEPIVGLTPTGPGQRQAGGSPAQAGRQRGDRRRGGRHRHRRHRHGRHRNQKTSGSRMHE